MTFKIRALLVPAFVLLAGPAFGQSAFDTFMAEEAENQEANEQRSEALQQFTAVLNGDDPAQAERAMKFMLESGDQELVRYASEFGLFSSDPRLQNAALAGIFNNKEDYRLVIDTSNNESGKAFMDYYSGVLSPDGNTGYLTISIGNYNEEDTCWPFRDDGRCAFTLTGTSVSLRGWSYVTGDLSLNSEGELEGIISYNKNAPMTVSIDLLN